MLLARDGVTGEETEGKLSRDLKLSRDELSRLSWDCVTTQVREGIGLEESSKSR